MKVFIIGIKSLNIEQNILKSLKIIKIKLKSEEKECILVLVSLNKQKIYKKETEWKDF